MSSLYPTPTPPRSSPTYLFIYLLFSSLFHFPHTTTPSRFSTFSLFLHHNLVHNCSLCFCSLCPFLRSSRYHARCRNALAHRTLLWPAFALLSSFLRPPGSDMNVARAHRVPHSVCPGEVLLRPPKCRHLAGFVVWAH